MNAVFVSQYSQVVKVMKYRNKEESTVYGLSSRSSTHAFRSLHFSEKPSTLNKNFCYALFLRNRGAKPDRPPGESP